MLATFCRARSLSLYLFHAENMVVRNIHPESQGCVIAAVYEDHAYLYEKGSKIQDLVRNRAVREIRPLPIWRLKSETPEKEEPAHGPPRGQRVHHGPPGEGAPGPQVDRESLHLHASWQDLLRLKQGEVHS